MQLEWDETKRAANLAKHGPDFADAERFDWLGATVVPDTRGSYGEERFRAFGMFEGRMHSIAYVQRGALIRLISFRIANRTERKRYGPRRN